MDGINTSWEDFRKNYLSLDNKGHITIEPKKVEIEDSIFNSQYKKLKDLAEQYKQEKDKFATQLEKHTTHIVGENTCVLKADGAGQVGLFIIGTNNNGIRIKINTLSKFIETLKEYETLSNMTEEEFNSYIRQREVLEKI